jgi:hypothetical protein
VFPWTFLALLTVLFYARLDLLIGLIIACTNRFAGHITRVVVERPLRVLARFLLVRSAVVMSHVISFLSFVTTVSNGAWFLRTCSWYQLEMNMRRERRFEGEGEGRWRQKGRRLERLCKIERHPLLRELSRQTNDPKQR